MAVPLSSFKINSAVHQALLREVRRLRAAVVGTLAPWPGYIFAGSSSLRSWLTITKTKTPTYGRRPRQRLRLKNESCWLL